jgi:hypothetical protein
LGAGGRAGKHRYRPARGWSPGSIARLQSVSSGHAANALSGCGCDREHFVAAVYAELQGKPIGDGAIGRAIRAVQVNFPPPKKPSRWDRDRPRFESLSKRSAA